MICIAKRNTSFKRRLIARGAELIDVIQHGSELEAQFIEEAAKLIKKGTWALYSEQNTTRTYEKVR